MPLDSRELLRAVNPIYIKVVSEDLPMITRGSHE